MKYSSGNIWLRVFDFSILPILFSVCISCNCGTYYHGFENYAQKVVMQSSCELTAEPEQDSGVRDGNYTIPVILGKSHNKAVPHNYLPEALPDDGEDYPLEKNGLLFRSNTRNITEEYSMVCNLFFCIHQELFTRLKKIWHDVNVICYLKRYYIYRSIRQ